MKNFPVGKWQVTQKGHIQEAYGAGWYGVAVGFRPHPMVAKAQDDTQPMNHGDAVEVVSMDGDQNISVILKERAHGKPTDKGVVDPGDGPVVPPPVFFAGLWIQHGGFWWQPHHNRESIPRMFLTAPTQPIYTNEPMAVWFEENTGNTIIALMHTGIDYSQPWSIKRNGDFFINRPSGGSPPVAVPACFIDPVGYLISENFDPSGGQLEPGNHEGFSLREVNFSEDTWTASYKEKIPNFTTGYMRPDEIANAARKTLPFKGLLLIPDGDHQNVSVLTPNFEVEGQNIRVDEASDGITFVEEGEEGGFDQQREGQLFFLNIAPVDTPQLYDYELPIELANLLFNELVIGAISGDNYGVKILMGSGRWLHFYYTYKDHDESIVDEQTVDGTSQVIIVRPRESQFIGVLGENREVPTYSIISINQISINGFSFPPDELATFSGDELTITVTLNNGDIVGYDIEGTVLSRDEQTIVTENNQNDFGIEQGLPGDGSLHEVYFLAQGVNGPDSGDDHEYTKICYILPGTNTVRLLVFWSAGEEIVVKYHYNTITGDYYKTSEMRVYEIGGNFSGQRVLKTPISEYILNPKIGRNASDNPNQRNIDESLGYYRDGQLFLEPNTKSYTIAAPDGLIWRSRALLTEPEPDIADPKVHFTFTPWPEEAESTDWYNTNPNYYEGNPAPETKIKNREDKWMGFCCGGPYGLQGSWNRYGGVLGDTNQFLRLWKRNTRTYVWENHKNLELDKLLPPDISTAGQKRIHAMGQTDYYNRANAIGDFNGFSVQLMPGKWPLARNYKAWIVAAMFVVEDFQADIDGYFNHDPNDRGWKDAGITFNAISPESGEILSQYTIRPSKNENDVIPVFEDPQKDLKVLKDANNESLDISIDKYYNHNPYYYGDNPEHELKPPHDGQNTVIASGRWATVPWNSGDIFALYSRNTGIGDKVDRILGYPGIPSFPGTRYGSSFGIETMYNAFIPWQTYQSPDTYAPLNNPNEPNLSMDEDGNIYFTLYMPCWQRWQDSYVNEGSNTEMVQRSYSQAFAGGEDSQPFFRQPVFFNGNLSDGNVEAYFNGAPTGHNYPGFDSGFLVPYTAENVYIPGNFVGYYEGTGNPETGYPGIPRFEYPSGTIEVRWYQPRVDDFTEILRPAGPFEYPSFLGFQATPMPVRGMAISNSNVDYAHEYRVVGKPFLFKLHLDQETGQITEKWRKDIGQPVNFADNVFTRYGEDYPTLPLANTSEAMANWTIACGRYIFVIKDGEYSNPNGTISSDFAVRKAVLKIFLNQDSEPELFKSIDIPNTEESINTALYYTTFATADIDPEGREHLFLKMSNGRTYSILMSLEPGDDPDIENATFHRTNGEPDFPETKYDANSMARAARSYFWLDNDNNVKKRTIP